MLRPTWIRLVTKVRFFHRTWNEWVLADIVLFAIVRCNSVSAIFSQAVPSMPPICGVSEGIFSPSEEDFLGKRFVK